MNELLTVSEVAKILRIDDTTVRRWVKCGAMPAVVLPHLNERQAYRIKRETMEKILGGTVIMEPGMNERALPGGIEGQEKAAQQELLLTSKLPKEGTITGKWDREEGPTNKIQLESIGFVFGNEIDDLFIACQLPQGWRIELSDHSMWSYVLDEKGRERMPIFYKGAFYDRSAHTSITHRYGIAEWRAASPDLPETD